MVKTSHCLPQIKTNYKGLGESQKNSQKWEKRQPQFGKNDTVTG